MQHITILLALFAFVAPATAQETFSQERAQHKTQLRRQGPSPQPFEPIQPPDGVKQMEYPSGELKLPVWVTADPGDGKEHPAIVYLHGGFAFEKGDWEDTRAYRDAGFVVLAPLLRGENGNPGHWEWNYGEVDDVLAAGKFAETLQYVDPKRIFVAGHSSGASNAILAAMTEHTPFVAAAAIGAYVTIEGFTNDPRWQNQLPFDPGDAKEVRLRSAVNFINSIQCPITLYVGEEDRAAQRRLPEFIVKAQAIDKKVTQVKLPGDHITSKPQALMRSAAMFKEMAGGG